MITLKDFQEFAQKRLTDSLNNPEQFSAKLKEVFDFAVANEKEMDEEANAYFDKVLSGIGDLMEQGLGKVADSAHKRKMLRLLALTQRKHHRADKTRRGIAKTSTSAV